MKITISIEFDGGIVRNEYPDIGNFKLNVKEILETLKSKGHEIKIWSSRTGKDADRVIKFLKDNKIPFDSFNYQENAYETFAHFYIDENNHGSKIVWDDIYEKVTQLAGDL